MAPRTHHNTSAIQENTLKNPDISRIIEMAWEDRTPFEAIDGLYGLSEPQVIQLMRQSLKRRSFCLWRARVSGRHTKHQSRSPKGMIRAYCPTQYKPR